MKNIILLVLALTVCVGVLFAQPVYGVRAGLNISTIGGEDDMDGIDSKIGANFGGMLQFPVATSIIFQPELLYTMKGAKSEYTDIEDGYTYTAKMTDSYNYLEIPLLFKYNVETPSMKIQPFIGPSVGILIGANSNTEVTMAGISASADTDIKEYMNTLELGLNLGADVVMMKNIMLGVRYNLGLSNIYKEQEGYQSKVKNRVIMINLGYLFGK